MKYFLSISLLCLLVSCSGSKAESRAGAEHSGKALFHVLDEVSCPNASDFRGAHISSNESEALAQARSNMALEHFAKKLESEIEISAQNINQIASSNARMNTYQNAALANPQDAKLHYSVRQGAEVGVVVCMSRADAAKGFGQHQQLVADSLAMVSQALPGIKHPKQKNEAWHRAQRLWGEFARVQGVLDGLGVARAELFGSASEMHSKAREDYRNYCKGQVYWAGSEDEYSDIVFAELSKRITMKKSACLAGLSLRFESSAKCASFAMGMECSFEPSLAVGSCDGEQYLLLKSKERVAGYDMHNRNKAKENLIAKMPSAAFLNEWETEIKGWMPQCIE